MVRRGMQNQPYIRRALSLLPASSVFFKRQALSLLQVSWLLIELILIGFLFVQTQNPNRQKPTILIGFLYLIGFIYKSMYFNGFRIQSNILPLFLSHSNFLIHSYFGSIWTKQKLTPIEFRSEKKRN